MTHCSTRATASAPTCQSATSLQRVHSRPRLPPAVTGDSDRIAHLDLSCSRSRTLLVTTVIPLSLQSMISQAFVSICEAFVGAEVKMAEEALAAIAKEF